MPSWLKALQIWNNNKPTWCIPRKGSVEYDHVKKIMDNAKTVKKTQESKNCECIGKKI
jgi:hypothetical protein